MRIIIIIIMMVCFTLTLLVLTFCLFERNLLFVLTKRRLGFHERTGLKRNKTKERTGRKIPWTRKEEQDLRRHTKLALKCNCLVCGSIARKTIEWNENLKRRFTQEYHNKSEGWKMAIFYLFDLVFDKRTSEFLCRVIIIILIPFWFFFISSSLLLSSRCCKK